MLRAERATSRKLVPVSESAVSWALDPLSMHHAVSKLLSSVKPSR